MQALENCDRENADNKDEDIEIEDEESKVDREPAQTKEYQLKTLLPARNYKI